MKQNDGGPAFARPIGLISHKEWSSDQEGMSLRDYLAAKAMQAILSRRIEGEMQARIGRDEFGMASPRDVAEQSYEYADAMIAAKKETP